VYIIGGWHFRILLYICLDIYAGISRCRRLFFFHIPTLADTVMPIDDLKIRLVCSDDPMSRRLRDLLESYDMTCKINSATHDCGGLLDIVTGSSPHGRDESSYKIW